MEYAEQISQHLKNVPGGSASIFPVKGESRTRLRVRLPLTRPMGAPASQGYLSLVSSSIVNQIFMKFLSRQPHARSDPFGTDICMQDRLRAALGTLAKVHGDPSIAERDPMSPLSFSCASAEVIKSQQETRATYEKGQRNAFSPLGLDGRPLRK